MVRTMSEGRDGQLRCQPPCPWRCCHPHPLSLAREGPKTLSPQMEWMGGWTGGWMGGGRPRDTAKATGLKQNRAGPQPSHCGHAVSTSEQVWSCADMCVCAHACAKASEHGSAPLAQLEVGVHRPDPSPRQATFPRCRGASWAGVAGGSRRGPPGAVGPDRGVCCQGFCVRLGGLRCSRSPGRCGASKP